MKRKTVFIADHHREIRRAVCDFFQHHDEFRVVGEIEDGSDIIDRVAELLPDILIVDIEMPGCNGIETTRIIKDRKLPVRVLVSTMFDDPLYKARALQMRAEDDIHR